MSFFVVFRERGSSESIRKKENVKKKLEKLNSLSAIKEDIDDNQDIERVKDENDIENDSHEEKQMSHEDEDGSHENEDDIHRNSVIVKGNFELVNKNEQKMTQNDENVDLEKQETILTSKVPLDIVL